MGLWAWFPDEPPSRQGDLHVFGLSFRARGRELCFVRFLIVGHSSVHLFKTMTLDQQPSLDVEGIYEVTSAQDSSFRAVSIFHEIQHHRR